MKEFDLIARLTRSLPTNKNVVIGAGDDCAILDMGMGDRLLLFKTDSVVQDVHFKSDDAPAQIGHKALARSLSDIAAMAGTPTAALVTLGLPSGYDPTFVEGIYEGINALARKHEVALVGGETTTNPGGIFISIALVGWVGRGKAILRSGAEPRDAVFVTGELGGSLCGKHLQFEPRLVEARWLAQHFSIHAMMDISDGLAGDLRHLLNASKVGAELLATSIPISREAKTAGRADAAKPPLLAALTDGEDFELLFTVASRDAVKVLDAWKSQFPTLRLTCIGKIFTGEGIRIRDQPGESARLTLMATIISHSATETEAFGEQWGKSVKPGTVIGLIGELGAGKTQFVKGFARGLGIKSRVHSPTFTLVNVYSGGRLTAFHLDLYRLETAGQIESAGISEYLQPNGVTLIEWADRLDVLQRARIKEVRFEMLSGDERRLLYDPAGA